MLLNKELGKFLRKKGSVECIRIAEKLESKLSEINNLHLRNLDLEVKDIADITTIIEKNIDKIGIKSISFSYNQQIGDVGAILLAKKLPNTIIEIGLVDCGISDKGGIEIISWMKKSTSLKMICIEQNYFSHKLKTAFNQFKKQNPNVVVIF